MLNLAVINAPQNVQWTPERTQLMNTPAAESNREEIVSHLESNRVQPYLVSLHRSLATSKGAKIKRQLHYNSHADYSYFVAFYLNIGGWQLSKPKVGIICIKHKGTYLNIHKILGHWGLYRIEEYSPISDMIRFSRAQGTIVIERSLIEKMFNLNFTKSLLLISLTCVICMLCNGHK